MRAALRVSVVALLATSVAALADERPATIPTRDVDVVYRIAEVHSADGGVRPLEQRMRWAAQAGILRVDPPVPGIYMIMDYRARRLSAVRDADRTVTDLDAARVNLPGAAGGAGAPSNLFKRIGDGQVAGVACVDWQTRDSAGQPTDVCISADGVLLRARSKGRLLLEASRVTYGASDPNVFRIPDGYKRVAIPRSDP